MPTSITELEELLSAHEQGFQRPAHRTTSYDELESLFRVHDGIEPLKPPHESPQYNVPPEQPGTLAQIGEFAQAIPRGAASTAVSMVEGVGRIGSDVLETLGVGDSDVAAYLKLGTQAMSNTANQAIQEALPVTPGFEDSWTRSIGEGIGSTIPSVSAAAVSGNPIVGIAGFGATTSYANTYDQVKQLGGTDADAKAYARASGLVGAVTEPFGAVGRGFKIFQKLEKATAGWIGKEIIKSAGEEAIQESIQEIPDEVARRAYLKDRKLIDSLEAVGRSGAVGGIVGGIFGTAATFIKAKYDQGNEKLIKSYEERKAAGQADPTPSQKEFVAVGDEGGKRSVRSAKIETYIKEKQDAASEVKANEEIQGGRPDAQVEAASQAKESQGAGNAVLGPKILGNDETYLSLKAVADAAKRSRSAFDAAKTRAENPKSEPRTPEEIAVHRPLHDIPAPVAQTMQEEARMQLERAKSPKTKEALEKIIADAGRDVGAAVAKQKQRILDILSGKIDQRNIFEKQIGVPERPVNEMIEAYKSGQPIEDADVTLKDTEFDFGANKSDVSQSEVQRPGLYGQETYDSFVGSQGELPMAPRQESNFPDVPGQYQFNPPPSRPTATSPSNPAGRPDLANPGIAQAVRAEVDKVDVQRNQQGRPATTTFEQQQAEAKRRLSENYQGELESFLNAEPRPLDAVETWVVRDLIETETIQSQLTNDLERQVRAQRLIDKYRDTGSVEASGFAARRDLMMNPAARMGLALSEPPEQIQKQIDKLKKKAAKENNGPKSGLKKKKAKAKEEFNKASDDLGRFLNGPLGANKFVHPQFAILVGKYVKAAVANATYSFADFIAETIRKHGVQQTREMFPHLSSAWESERKANSKMTPAKEMEIAIKEAFKKIAEDDRITALRRGWARRASELKEQLKSAGYDIDAVLSGKADPVAAMQAVAEVEAAKAPLSDKAYELWISNILSGIVTHTTNIAGTMYNFGKMGFVDRAVQATLDSAARAAGIREGGARFGEFKPLVQGTWEAMGLAAKNFAMVWRSDMAQFNAQRGRVPSAIYDIRSPKIRGKKGRIIRTPLRALVAADDAIKTLIAGGEGAALAYRAGREEGLSGEALSQRMRQLIADPTESPFHEATDRAIEYAFQEETPRVQQVAGLIKSVWGLRYKVPFVVTLSNLLRLGIRSTPAGSLALAHKLINAVRTGDWTGIDRRIAEQVVGITAMLALAYTIDDKDPWITGTEDRNHPQSIKFPGTDTWWSYARIDPLATMLGITIDTINKWRKGGDAVELASAPFESVLKQIDTKSFLDGISDIIKAFEQRSLNPILEWGAKFPASWIPNLVRQPVRALDDTVPERRVYDKGQKRLEIMAKRGVQATEFAHDFPKYDLWGRSVPRDGGPLPNTDFLFRVLSPVQVKKYQDTIGDRVIQSWNANHPDDPITKGKQPPQRDYKVNGKTVYMNDEEYDAYVRIAGERALQRIQDIHFGTKDTKARPFNLDNPTLSDRKILEKIIDDSREISKRQLLKKNAA